MEAIRRIIVLSALFTLCIFYFGNYPALMAIYPKVSEDYYQFVAFWSVRAKIYDAMLSCSFWIIFMASKDRIFKAVGCFMMIMSTGSFIDKLAFGINSYLVTDILLVIVSLIISRKVYVRKVESK